MNGLVIEPDVLRSHYSRRMLVRQVVSRFEFGDPRKDLIEKYLLTFICSCIIHELLGPFSCPLPRGVKSLATKQDNKKHRKEAEDGVKYMKTWDWSKVNPAILVHVDRLVRDFDYVFDLEFSE